MLREIVLDTETTGFDPTEGHRLIEVGGVELSTTCRPASTCIST
jgi:DNA polymerase-3 subunit epsilon